MVDWLVYLLAFYIGCNHSANHQWRIMQHQQAKEILDRLKRLEDAVERLESSATNRVNVTPTMDETSSSV